MTGAEAGREKADYWKDVKEELARTIKSASLEVAFEILQSLRDVKETVEEISKEIGRVIQFGERQLRKRWDMRKYCMEMSPVEFKVFYEDMRIKAIIKSYENECIKLPIYSVEESIRKDLKITVLSILKHVTDSYFEKSGDGYERKGSGGFEKSDRKGEGNEKKEGGDGA